MTEAGSRTDLGATLQSGCNPTRGLPSVTMRVWSDTGAAGMGGSAVRRRQLARELRELRESSGYTLEEAAVKLEWSTSKLSRIETGQQTVDIHSVRGMLDLYDLGGDRAGHIQELCRAARQRGWWKAYGLDDLGYVALETEATLIREFALAYVPGLLQTSEYAGAVLATSVLDRTDKRMANSIATRMIRQRRLVADADSVELRAVIDESVLFRPVGGVAVIRAQLAHLLNAALLPTVTLRVLPQSIGAHQGLDGPFTILRFEDAGEPDIAYVEHSVGSVQVSTEPEVRRATLAFDRLWSAALSADDTIKLLRGLLEQTLGRRREPDMDLSDLEWRKSSFSGENGNSGCIELALLPDGGVAIRDSKDHTLAPHVYTAAEWEAFVLGVHAGEFDLPG